MEITNGSRLGPYEIISRLGAGGMGEVWRARDTRLDRAVAVKVLPAELAANANFRARFEREAKTISQLNDPHTGAVTEKRFSFRTPVPSGQSRFAPARPRISDFRSVCLK